MARPRRSAAYAVLAGAMGIGVAIYAQQGHVANTSLNIATEVTDAVLRRAGTANDALPGSWLSYGRTQGETRYSTLKQIDTTNAKRLGLAWSYVMGAGGGNQEGTPLMWNNTLYGITTWSVVFALDARTGKELWRWDPEDQPDHRAADDLLRHRESRHRALQRHDHRAVDRRPPVRAERAHGQAGVGNARRVSAAICTR